MTLAELLTLKKLEAVNVVAGQKGLGRKITGAVMLDNPDMANWMRDGEILLTTGYVIKNDVALQLAILDDLIKNNAGALAVKVKRYMDEIPHEVLKKADECGFPVLQIPYYLSLSDVSEAINKQIYLDQYSVSSNANLSQALFDFIQRGSDIKAILDQSEQFAKGSFAFLDVHMKAKSFSVSFPQKSIKDINTGAPQFSEDKLQEMTYPVKSSGELLGHLLFLPSVMPEDQEETDSICQKIALSISMTILRERTFISFKTRETEKFLDSLVTEGELTHSEIVKSANYCNIPLDATYICSIISFYKKQELNETNDWVGIKSLNRKGLASSWETLSHNPCRILVKNNNIILILSQNDSLSPHEQVSMVGEYCEKIKKELIDPHYTDLVFFGIGEPTSSLAQFYRSYSQALRAVDLMSKRKEEFVGYYRKYILYELIVDSPSAKLALTERLKPLLDYDLQHKTNLVETLTIYFKNCQNSISASKELFVHRNTLLYRLERISEILDLDFSSDEQLLIIQLALKALII